MDRTVTPAVAVTLASFLTSLNAVPGAADDESPISRVLFGSCVKQDRPVPILSTVVDARPELFLFIGDNIYGDTEDMQVLKAKYEKLGADDGFRRLRQACPLLATWDDHDYGVNDGGASYPKRVASQKVFLDFWRDSPESIRRRRPGVYDAHVFGPKRKRLQIILLDTRYFRSELKKGPERRTGGPYVPDDDSTKTMLGEGQWTWLEQQLRKPAEVRIVASSIQCVSEDAGQETWSNLPRERQRLFRLIDETKANGVFIVSGDRHWAELSSATEGVPYPLYDLTSSSLNQLHKRGTPTKNRYRISDTTWHKENFGVVLIDWEKPDPEISLQVRDLQGAIRIEKRVLLSTLQGKR